MILKQFFTSKSSVFPDVLVQWITCTMKNLKNYKKSKKKKDSGATSLTRVTLIINPNNYQRYKIICKY